MHAVRSLAELASLIFIVPEVQLDRALVIQPGVPQSLRAVEVLIWMCHPRIRLHKKIQSKGIPEATQYTAGGDPQWDGPTDDSCPKDA